MHIFFDKHFTFSNELERNKAQVYKDTGIRMFVKALYWIAKCSAMGKSKCSAIWQSLSYRTATQLCQILKWKMVKAYFKRKH